MIPTKFTRDDLVGRYVRPVRTIRNGAGVGITPQTRCEILDVVRGHGITIKTEKCKCCGMCAFITGIARQDLELIENSEQEGQE